MRLWQRTFLIDILTTPISHSYMPPQWGDLTGMCLIWTIFWVNWCCTVWSFMTWNDFWISSSPFCNVFNWHYHTGSVNKFYTLHSDTRMQEGTDWLSEGGVRGVRKPQNRTENTQKNRKPLIWPHWIFFPNTETTLTWKPTIWKLTSARLVIYSDNIVR